MLFAIDVGTTKVCTLVAEALSGEELRVIGMGNVPARGMQKGAVVNVEEASQAIQASLAEAERMSGLAIEQAVVSLSGVQIASVNSRGST
ncbi:MAG: cell division FtsA domain-containing protein, partial [Anaerolineae bacterium]